MSEVAQGNELHVVGAKNIETRQVKATTGRGRGQGLGLRVGVRVGEVVLG